MSTILNALKRLEEESAANEASQVPVPLHGQPKAPKRHRRRGLILTAALVVMGGGAALFWFSTSRPEKTPSPVASEPKPPTVADISSGSVERPSASKPSGEAITPTRREAGVQADQAATKSATRASKSEKTAITSPNYVPPDIVRQRRSGIPAASVSAGKGAPPFSEGPNPASQALARPASTSNVDAPPTRRKQSATQDPHASTEVLAQDTLKLQAISWSEIPAERITIIAGRILREGQNVDGYNVVEIRSQDVIVEKSGSLWKLIYNAQ